MPPKSLAAKPKQHSPRTGGVQSVERALHLLNVLGADEEGYRLTDLAQITGLSPSTVHRLLATLESQRYVQFDQSDGMWHVGRQAFLIGSAFVRRRNFVAPSLPFLRQLRDQTKETANIGVLDEGEIVTLAQVESREITRAISPVGGRAPLISSGMGKAILATYPPADVKALTDKYGMRRVTPNTFSSFEALTSELALIRQQGYAVDDEEFVLGLRCVAAIVYNQQAEALCAISISGLTSRVSPARVPELGKLLAKTAHALTTALGGRQPEK